MKMEASVDPQCRGPDWMPITPKTGSLFHAETHQEIIAPAKPLRGDRRDPTWLQIREVELSGGDPVATQPYRGGILARPREKKPFNFKMLIGCGGRI